MHYRNFRLVCLIFVLTLFMQLAACGSDSNNSTPTPTSFPVVVFSDVHFNPYDDPSLFKQLVTADVGQWAAIFKSSTLPAPSTFGSDANYPLFALALSSIKQNLGASPLVIFTGDILVHSFSEQFYQNYSGNKAQTTPRNAADVAAMQAFAHKTIAFFMDQVKASVGSIPVMFTVGNNDSYNDTGPDSTFLANTAELFYSKFLTGTVDQQEFLTSYKNGGYYAAELPGTNLLVIGLNTVAFSNYITTNNDAAVHAELAWFDAKLASAKASGKKVWLLMHVPPGADNYKTAKLADSKGHIDTTSATMMWKTAYQTGFLQTVAKYPGVITMTLAGHTHLDEYRILPSSEVVEIAPAISTRNGNDPAFKVLTVARDTLKTSDYVSLNYDLTAKPVQFTTYYLFSTSYGLQGLLNDSLTELFPLMRTDRTKQALYRGYYYSGNNALNPITDTNWPIYWCGIGNMGQPEFINCVNSF